MIVFVNNIDQNLFEIGSDRGKELGSRLDTLIKKVNPMGITCADIVYYITNTPIIIDGKIVTKIESIQIIITDNFPYVLKQLATHKKLTKKSIVLSNNLWEYYLISLWVNVYNYRNNKVSLVTYDTIEKRFGLKKDEVIYLNDYIFLQEKNDENGLGEKKTRELLLENKGIENILDNIQNIENIRSRELINYQREKISFYATTLKKIFITSSDVYES